MSHWKVILAALVIFTAGVFAGGVGGRLFHKVKPAPRSLVEQPLLPFIVTEEFVHRLKQEMDLEPAQRERIVKTLWASQARVRELYSLVGPEVSEELHYVREAIRSELTPEQRQRFEELVRKQRQRRWGDTPRAEGPRNRSPEGLRPDSNSQRGPFRVGPRDSAAGDAPRAGERRQRPERGQTNSAPRRPLPEAPR